MSEVLFLVTTLFIRRAIWVRWVALSSVGIALTWLPLMGQPGYELSGALAVLLTFGGAGLAITCARAAPRRIFAAALLLMLVPVPALAVATFTTLWATPCDPFASPAFVPLLIVPTALLVAATGALAASLTERRWLAFVIYFGAVALTALVTCWPLLAGPQIFAFNHFGGYFPGPLYDEELDVSSALLWFRLTTVFLACGLWSLVQQKRFRALAFLSLGLGLEIAGVSLGFRTTDAAVAEALGGITETSEFSFHYPKELSEGEQQQVLGDLRFRHHQIASFLGRAPDVKVRIWLYRSADEKRRLVGAAHTQFAKPWRHEVHLNASGFPHPVIKHELVHAMAAPWGSPPFGIAATLGGLMPHVGVIEGLAVAADNPIDDLSLHEWAAAMKKKGLLPRVEKLMTVNGFYAAPPSRAYTTAGSFLRFLQQRHGPEKLLDLYRDGDFERVFKSTLVALAQEYDDFLAQVPLEPEAVNQAFGRFSRGSVFDRPCAREVARLAVKGSEALGSSPEEALELFSDCHRIQPDEPSHVLAQVIALRRLGQFEKSREMLDEELARLEKEPSPWGEAALALADLAETQGELDTAARLWSTILDKNLSPSAQRTASIRLDGLHEPAVQGFFHVGNDEVKLLRLEHSVSENPNAYAARYLFARRLFQNRELAAALPEFERLLQSELPPAVAKETTRLAIEAAFGLAQCELLETLAAKAQFGPAFQARAADWVERCAFSRNRP